MKLTSHFTLHQMSENILNTTYTFHHRQYLLKLNSADCLEIVLTDKQTGEEWECSYDVAYIENLTRKTGNFKQFEIFTTMLKSGLLKTSECISLDLLTLKDLESMRARKVKSSSKINMNGNNRRYLIVTYSVEFDKIKYPIPLEYCGLPDPAILQATVKKLETKLKKSEEELSTRHDGRRYIKSLERRIDELTVENNHLNDEVKRLAKLLNKNPAGQVQVLQKAIMQLEKSVQTERNSHHRLVQKLQSDKVQLANELEQSKKSEKELKYKIHSLPQCTIKNKQNNQKIKKSPVMYDTKDSCTRNIKLTQRSRSASPRLIRPDKQRAVDRRFQQCKPQPTSRSSSASSKKEFWNNFSASGSQIRSRESSPSSRFRGSTSTLSYTSIIVDKNTVAKERTAAPSNRFSVRSNKIENRFNKTLKKYN